MGSGEREPFNNTVVEWIDSRMPIFTMLQKEYGVFPAPKNFNYLWNFGAIAMFMLVTMIATGLVLAMHYTANTELAFDSVERIMRDVNGGWLIRYIHMNGASFFFIAVYIHIFRGMYYGSYKKPRELLWILGALIFLLMMATAFLGYVLPWGQMSLWGATVITGFFTAIPYFGEDLQTLLLGGFSVDNPTLTRFFALHYLLPFVIFAVVFLHIWALHVTGSNNPLGIDTKGPQDTLPFHPYYTIKDSFGLLVFIIIYCVFIFFMPDVLGHPDNYIKANPLVTPPHIVPEWYFLPFYAILRAITFGTNLYLIGSLLCAAYAFYSWMLKNEKGESLLSWCYLPCLIAAAVLAIPGCIIAFVPIVEGSFIEKLRYIFSFDFLISDDLRGTKAGFEKRANIDMVLIPIPAKLGGVLAMFGSVAMLFVLPWLDTHPVRSARYRPLYKLCFLLLVVIFLVLGYVGSQPADASVMGVPLILVGLAGTGYYYMYFLVLLPLLSRFEKTKPLPESIHQAVLSKQVNVEAKI
ncbi:MAG: cytochrome b N-terminal domain-containing protein [Alphaproteobacteria bacterium]|nr:cytochrome b N-terminal domain-containing protein [Alphaproteobacteria bacterium]QQS56036.1 MAG: cytochrome b N-terminal domain-containing protein [Alphaproteobacteria bacterium]